MIIQEYVLLHLIFCKFPLYTFISKLLSHYVNESIEYMHQGNAYMYTATCYLKKDHINAAPILLLS